MQGAYILKNEKLLESSLATRPLRIPNHLKVQWRIYDLILGGSQWVEPASINGTGGLANAFRAIGSLKPV